MTTTTTTVIEKRSSNKTIDAYRSTAPQEIDGRWVVITAYRRGMARVVHPQPRGA